MLSLSVPEGVTVVSERVLCLLFDRFVPIDDCDCRNGGSATVSISVKDGEKEVAGEPLSVVVILLATENGPSDDDHWVAAEEAEPVAKDPEADLGPGG